MTTQKPLTTERQKELWRVINDCYDEYDKRGQHQYKLNGMTTAHVTLHAIGDFTTLKVFWPAELVQTVRGGYYSGGSTTYLLENDTITKVQSSIRSALDQLADKGYIEKTGNLEERRWLPVRPKKPETKEAFDKDGNLIGTMEKVDGKWALVS